VQLPPVDRTPPGAPESTSGTDATAGTTDTQTEG